MRADRTLLAAAGPADHAQRGRRDDPPYRARSECGPNARRGPPPRITFERREGEGAGPRGAPLPRRRRTICRRPWPACPTTATGPSPSGRRRACPWAAASRPSCSIAASCSASASPSFLQPRDGPARAIPYAPDLFELGPDLKGQSFAPDLGFAGFRLHYAFDGRPAGGPGGIPGLPRRLLLPAARHSARNTGSRPGAPPSAPGGRARRNFPTSPPSGSASPRPMPAPSRSGRCSIPRASPGPTASASRRAIPR